MSIVSLIKYLLILSFGLLLGYGWFAPAKKNDLPPSDEQSYSLAKDMPVTEPVSIDVKPIKTESTPNDSQAQIQAISANYQNQIALMQARIDELEKLVLAKENNEVGQAANPQLETISLDDFQKRMKEQLVERFKGVALKLEGELLEQVRMNFDNNLQKGDWNAAFENHIVQFIHQSDPAGLHFVDELSCNQDICRMKITSADTGKWQNLYSEMTAQGWYNSLTMTETTGNPNSFIYYIPKPELETY